MKIRAQKFLVPAIAGVFALAACNDASVTDPHAVAGLPVMAVTVDLETGIGFVGKGDVQLLYGWNNQQLQNGAGSVGFRISSITQTTWTCTKPHPAGHDDIVQERNRTTTLQGLVTTIARQNSSGKNGPITGFNLAGYNGTPTSGTKGPAVGSCPANPSGFVYDDNAETTSLGGGLQVSINDTDWFDIQ